MPTTAGRSRGRQGVRSGAQGAVGEHLSKVMTALITGLVVIAFALVMTKPGQDIDAATQHFMLFYAGVFALIGLTALVGVGLVATDRIVMTPGHRVMAQAVHRAVSFGALAFLVIHIVTEILAQRAHVIDAFIPFLSPYRTFYIGLGTIASDLILLIVVTSIWRKRFTAHGKAWRWRAIHYSSYVAFVFGVLHGLLGGREAKPYVDWSYGFAIALTALAVVVRFLAISLRSKDKVGASPGADRAVGGLGYSGTSPLRSAALSMAQAQLSGTIQMLPTAVGAQGSGLGLPGSQAWAALPPAPDWAASSGPQPALPAGAGYAADPSLMPLGAPVYGESATAGTGSYPYPAAPGRQPLYEPEYDGPPRFQGAPRQHVSQDDLSSYPYAAQDRPPGRGNGGPGPLPLSPPPRLGSAPTPRTGTGPMPRADSGPMPPRVGPMPDRLRPDAATRVGSAAPDRLRPDAATRVRPDAHTRDRFDASRRFRPDAPPRVRPDPADRHRPDAAAGDGSRAARRLRPDAAARVGSRAARRLRPGSPARGGPGTPPRYRPDAPDRHRSPPAAWDRSRAARRLRPAAPARDGPDAPRRLRPDAAARVRPDADTRDGPDVPDRLRPDAAAGIRPDADTRDGLDAPRRHRSHAASREEPDAASRFRPDAAPGFRPDAASRFRPDATPGFRPDAPSWIRPDAPGQYRPDAAARYRPPAARRLRSHAAARIRPGASCRLRPGAPARDDPGAWRGLRFGAVVRHGAESSCRRVPAAHRRRAPSRLRVRAGR